MRLAINDRIHLTEFEARDKLALLAHLREKDIYDRTLRIPYPYTESDADEWLALTANRTGRPGRSPHWAIRNKDGDLIGGFGFDGLEIGQSHRAEIGYWLAKPHWGQGIMSAVVQCACKFAFDQWGLIKITAHVFAENSASARVLEKSGFEQEGFLRKHYQKDGRLIDARLFGLLK